MTDTRRSYVGPLTVFTGPNRHTAIDRWFATVKIVIQQHKIVIQQQIDGSLHFAEEQLSSANLLSHAAHSIQTFPMRLHVLDLRLERERDDARAELDGERGRD